MSEPMKTAKAGEVITPKACKKLRTLAVFFAHVLSTPEGRRVAPKSDAKGGQWVCADCGDTFQNNMGAHGHAKAHRRAWWTGSQFEEP